MAKTPSHIGPGPKLIGVPPPDDLARSMDGTGREWLCGELWAAVLDMGSAGLLSQEEQRWITIPIGLRTLDEIRAPFAERRRVAALELEHAEILKVSDPFWDDFQKSGDRQQLARRHPDLMRAWSGPTIMGLIEPGRDRSALTDDLFGRFAGRIAADPLYGCRRLGEATLIFPQADWSAFSAAGLEPL